jgi:hypothetical protein
LGLRHHTVIQRVLHLIHGHVCVHFFMLTVKMVGCKGHSADLKKTDPCAAVTVKVPMHQIMLMVHTTPSC